MYRLTNLTRVAAVGVLVILASCESERDLLGPAVPVGGELFKSYVAIGNSITAGFQSAGINDSTQRQSYARLLAGQMGTQYHYPSLAGRGCSPPIANTQTGALVGVGSTSSTCDLRAASSVTDILNNVAVPGARVLDPTSASTAASNALTTFILGGKTQVQKALEAEPTFASIWIGNNDVLVAGLSGILVPVGPPLNQNGIISTQAQFQAAYDAMIAQLTAGAPGLKGVLIGVAQVANLPTLSSGALIASTPTIQAGISAAAGKPVTIHPDCVGSASLINVPQIIAGIRANNPATPPVIVCSSGEPGFPFPIGDLYVLSATEQATLASTITGYNTYIKSKADGIGFAHYDPNILFAAKRASGEIPPFPNLASPTATFGPLISLDGVHPTGAGHLLIANEIIAVINAKYATTLKPAGQ